MEKLTFVSCDPDDRDAPVAIEAGPLAAQAVLLGCRPSGTLTVHSLAPRGLAAHDRETESRPLAVVASRASGSDVSWYLLPLAAIVSVNGLSPLPLVRLDSGSVLTFGCRGWWVATLFSPTPQAAPPELQDKLCPVCGGPLGLAPVVRCPCGRWSHLERPDAPQSAEALNCYIAAAACICGRATTLSPEICPRPPQTFLPRADTDHLA